MLVWIVFRVVFLSAFRSLCPPETGWTSEAEGVDFSFFLLSDFVVLTSS